jgi:septal ring factor EnvC (AmiA/AmiB activator)
LPGGNVPDELNSGSVRNGTLAAAVFVLLLQVPIAAVCAEATDASATALQQAQRRFTAADEELRRAKRQARDAEERVKDAEEARQEATRELEEAKARLERARADRVAADAAVADAQRQYDQARSVIEQIYSTRQGVAR